MGGPIVRTGATPEFWKNWDQVFGDKPGKKSGTTVAKKTAAAKGKAAAKTANEKSAAKKTTTAKKDQKK